MKSTGAKFYKSALQVNSYVYNQRHRGGALFSEEAYNSDIVKHCLLNKIEVVGLAEHGSVSLTENLRRDLESAGVFVFPGFELSSAEKIHIICLFPPDMDSDRLNQVLGQLQGGSVDPQNTVASSSETYIEIARKTQECGGITFAAHVEHDNGLLKVNDGKGGHHHTWKDEKYLHAVQIGKPSVNDLDQKFRSIIQNKDANYKRERKVAVINAKDIHTPETLTDETASCWIKMDEPSIEGLRQAFLDGDSRIRLNADKPKDDHAKILRIELQSRFFRNELDLHLNPNLNALIGGRGTGKSTLIECIRYCLELGYHADESKERSAALLKENFTDGRAVMHVFSARYNKTYAIERLFGHPPVIKNPDGSLSNLSVKDILPEIEVYGQNEIFEFAEKPANHIKILKRFLPGDTDSIPDLQRKLLANRNKLTEALDRLDELEAKKNREKQLKERQDALHQLGLDKMFEEQGVYSKEEERVINRSDREFADIQNNLNRLIETVHETDLHYLSSNALSDLINQEVLGRLKPAWSTYLQAMQACFDNANKAADTFTSELAAISADWLQKKEAFYSEFEKRVRALPDTAGRKGEDIAKEFTSISRELAAVHNMGNAYERQSDLIAEIRKQRNQLLNELDNALHARYVNINSMASRLNKGKLKGKIRIEVSKHGIRKALKEQLKNLPGIGERRVSWVDEKKDLTIRQLAYDIAKMDVEALKEAYGITTAVAESLLRLENEQFFELEETVMDESLTINLNVGSVDAPVFKNITGLSSGQKCTAILHLLLLESKDPLIVDQPEDNLDNAFIAENIVRELRDQKESRQFIFSTHNANIPIFGDAEWIGVMEIEDSCALIRNEHIGSIDNARLKPLVENILEGGKQAFEMRRMKYNF